jgi:tetratricopeptide (TPR) repeat protein
MLGIFVGRQRWKHSADFQIECGDGYFEINDYESALVCYAEALRIAPNNMLARFYRGSALAERGDGDAAIADFDEVIRQEPLNYSAYSYRGYTYFGQKRYELAITDF